MEYAQELYASEMELQGFGRKTFTLERNHVGDVVVHRVNGKKTARAYQNRTFDAVMREMPDRFNPNELMDNQTNNFCACCSLNPTITVTDP